MKIPRGKNGKSPFGIRDVCDILGDLYPVHVIDVETQQELEGWTLGDLVEYFEDGNRLAGEDPQQEAKVSGRRQRRAAAENALIRRKNQPKVLNQISMEVSQTRLRPLVKSPQFVRDLDWIDHAWPALRREIQKDYPAVQYYCLTSAAGCYTDFHLDFGGTSVWYHVLSGSKQFILVPPTKENLEVYEAWLCRSDQLDVFLLDMMKDCDVLKVSLEAAQTLFIPTGWIHAVYTPEDSLVFGGNFLHGLSIALQLSINSLEVRTRVKQNFRFPHYQSLQFYAGGMYLQKMRAGDITLREVDGLKDLVDSIEAWWNVRSVPDIERAAKEAAKSCGCETVECMLEEFRAELQRMLNSGIRRSPTCKEEVKPKLRIKLPEISSSSSPPKEKKSSGFRITVPTSVLAASPRSVHKRPAQQDDLDEFVPDVAETEDQEEWFPTKKATAKKPRVNLSFPRSKGTGASGPSPSKKPVNSRQRLSRLMKKFK
jgi:F-box/leucine-rich repeat protein 10/11